MPHRKGQFELQTESYQGSDRYGDYITLYIHETGIAINVSGKPVVREKIDARIDYPPCVPWVGEMPDLPEAAVCLNVKQLEDFIGDLQECLNKVKSGKISTSWA